MGLAATFAVLTSFVVLVTLSLPSLKQRQLLLLPPLPPSEPPTPPVTTTAAAAAAAAAAATTTTTTVDCSQLYYTVLVVQLRLVIAGALLPGYHA